MSELNTIRFGDSTIEFQVRRSDRRKKTIQITVDGGGVQVSAPIVTPNRDLQAIVRKRAPWILGHSSEGMLNASPKQFVSGETLPYLGRNVRLLVESGRVGSPDVRFDHWRFRIVVPDDWGRRERYTSIRRSVVAWYRDRAKERLSSLVDRWWPLLGVGQKSIVLIRDQRQRWGSCAPDGKLRFNWRAAMLKPSLVEYIVVHELAHLTLRHHSKEFWVLLSDVMPDVQQRRKALSEAGRWLPL